MTTFPPRHKTDTPPQWAIWPFVRDTGQIGNAPPLVLTGTISLDGLAYANSVKQELKRRGIACYVDVI